MRYELKTIPFWPVLKVGFFVNLVVGLLVGILYAMFLIPFVALMSSIPAFESGGFDFGGAPLGLMMFIMPIISALTWAFFGTVFLVIVVLVYNLTAKLVGGLELNLEKVESRPEPVVAAVPPAAQTPPEYYSPPPLETRPPPPPPAQPETPPKPAPDDTQRGPADSTGSDT